MKNEIILRKAIEKAIKNDRNFENGILYDCGISGHKLGLNIDHCFSDGNNEILGVTGFYIIFSHDFAKAFWGDEFIEKECGFNCGKVEEIEAWQYHLQQMVLEPEPLKYLEKFL